MPSTKFLLERVSRSRIEGLKFNIAATFPKNVLNGKKVGKGFEAVYFSNKAFFTKQGLTRKTVVHEFYHHLVEVKGLELPERMEEKEANGFARKFL